MAEERGPEDGDDGGGGGGGGGNGVLLYYKYAPVPDIDALVRLYESNCRSLALLGRVRVGPDGVNVTVRDSPHPICWMRDGGSGSAPVVIFAVSRICRSAGSCRR